MAPPRTLEFGQFNFVTGEWKNIEANSGNYLGVESAAALPDGSGVIFCQVTTGGACKVSIEGSRIDEAYPFSAQSLREGFRVRQTPNNPWVPIVDGVDLATGAARTIYQGGDYCYATDVQVSPDGKFLSFIEWEEHNFDARPICIVDIETNHVVKVIPHANYNER